MRDFAEVRAGGVITAEVADEALRREGVDELGLDRLDRAFLRTIVEQYAGGPVGINAIAATLTEDDETLEDVVEPYLLKIGLRHAHRRRKKGDRRRVRPPGNQREAAAGAREAPVKRRHFLSAVAAAAGAAALPQTLRAQDDPALSSETQALRVLLGTGRLQNIDAQTFLYEGRRYRGTAVILPETGQVVSTVPVEQYLYSVVSREMPRSWPAEALQAQAILARTYVLQRSNPNRDYDLVTSEADQVYTGIDAEACANERGRGRHRGPSLAVWPRIRVDRLLFVLRRTHRIVRRRVGRQTAAVSLGREV